MRILSLFDGVSCARLSIEKAGIKISKYFASEIDKYALRVVQSNRPDTIQLGDIKTLANMTRVLMQISPIDLLIGGSPCQDLSIAKSNRKGLQGDKSNLFYEYVKILHKVEPEYFILENVASMSKDSKNQISKILGVDPIMINASLVSAQNRKRLFWVGKFINGKYEQVEISQPIDKGIFLKDILEGGETERLKSYCIDANYFKGASYEHYKNKGKRQLIFLGGLKNKDSSKDGKKSPSQGNRVYSSEGKSVSLSANGGGRGAKTGLYAIALRNRGSGKQPEYNNTNKANSLTTVVTDSMVEVDTKIRKLTPLECERLQCMPDNWTNPTGDISNTQRYKMCGNAFNVDVVKHILISIKQQNKKWK